MNKSADFREFSIYGSVFVGIVAHESDAGCWIHRFDLGGVFLGLVFNFGSFPLGYSTP